MKWISTTVIAACILTGVVMGISDPGIAPVPPFSGKSIPCYSANSSALKIGGDCLRDTAIVGINFSTFSHFPIIVRNSGYTIEVMSPKSPPKEWRIGMGKRITTDPVNKTFVMEAYESNTDRWIPILKIHGEERVKLSIKNSQSTPIPITGYVNNTEVGFFPTDTNWGKVHRDINLEITTLVVDMSGNETRFSYSAEPC